MNDDKATTELTHDEAIAALERFVVDNDELLELEERIGRFNIFDALGVVRQEIRHSNFLAWLLDPAESHGQGQLFLKAILMDLLRVTPLDRRPMSPIELDGDELGGVEVRREWKNIDLLIVANDPRIVIAIENKIDSSEHSDQLSRYRRTIVSEFREFRPLYVFLTPDGIEPSQDDWVSWTYGGIHRALDQCIRRNAASIGDDVLAFIQHYQNVLKGRLMDDPEIDELCKTIYRNHRQAIDLIAQRYGNPRTEIAETFVEILNDDDIEWEIDASATGASVHFLPRNWLDWLPPIRTQAKKSLDLRQWIWIVLEITADWIVIVIRVAPTSQPHLRQSLIDAVSSRGSDVGLVCRKPGTQWSTIYSKTLTRRKEEIVLSPKIEKKLRNSFEELKRALPGIERFIRTAIERRVEQENINEE